MRTRNAALNVARRQEILKAASDCFVSRGFHATSMKDVCAAAGMSPGTLYHYFASKAEIIAGLIEAEQQLTAELLASVRHGPDVVAALFDALDAIASSITARDLVLHTEVAAEVLRQPELKQAAIAAELNAEAELATAIRHGQETGQLDRSLDSAQAARNILALIDGLLGQAALHGFDVFTQQLPAVRQMIARMLVDPDGGR